MRIQSLLFIACFFCFEYLHAQVRVPRLVGDSMILQRDVKIPIWGWASPGEMVTIDFNGGIYTVNTGDNGKWSLSLPAMKAGGPYTMTIHGKNKIKISDVLIGDVWLCSGQSNMEFKMSQAKEKYADVIAGCTNSDIRVLTVAKQLSFDHPKEDIRTTGWKTTTPYNILNFTAVGYFTARALYEKYKVPIGLIHSSWGGTAAQGWVSEDGLKPFPKYIEELNGLKDMDSAKMETIIQQNKAEIDEWYLTLRLGDKGLNGEEKWRSDGYDASTWQHTQLPVLWNAIGLNGSGVTWFRKEVDIPASAAGKTAMLFLGSIKDQDTTWFNGVKVGSATDQAHERKYTVPGKSIKAGKNVIVVRVVNGGKTGGFIKTHSYQLVAGEVTIDIADGWQYKQGFAASQPLPRTITYAGRASGLYNGMIAPLVPYAIKGVLWYQGETNAHHPEGYDKLFPALITDWRSKWLQGNLPFIYVQIANYLEPVDSPGESPMADIRYAQFKTLSLPNTGMAVIHDIGEAKNIHPLNKMDVGNRLALAAEKVAYGEKDIVYSGPTYESMKIKGDKVTIKFDNCGSGLIAKGDGELKYFSIAGADKKFVWATAKIEGDKVIVWSDKVAEPVAVRYAWANDPEGANLYNKEGLPASCFKTDDWPVSAGY